MTGKIPFYFYKKWQFYLFIIPIVTVIIGYVFVIGLGEYSTFLNMIKITAINTAVLWSGCMGIVFWTWKKYPWEEVPVKHLIIETIAITAFLLLFIVVRNFMVTFEKNNNFWEELKLHGGDIMFTMLISFLMTTLHEAYFFFKQWQLNFSKSISLEKDNLEARYNALKSQVNPHFLFNSLNSLMSLLENNPRAEQYVQDLSDYLRYVLLSSSRETVTLQEEIENLEKYINLQKLRFGDNFQVDVSINRVSLNAHLPPLALQMLVENCVKHNIITHSHPLKVTIFDDEKSVTVINNLQKKQDHESTGHGLKNIEGRYRFAQEGNVKIHTDEHIFSVNIPLLKNKS